MNNIKKEVKSKILEYSNDKYLDGYIKNEFLTDKGDANIYIRLRSIDDLFDSRTVGNQIDLNCQVYEYLDDKTSMLDNDVQINFHVLGLDLSQSNKEKVRHLIKEHYAIELYKTQKLFRRYKAKIIKLLAIGIIFLSFYFFTAFYFESTLFMEVFSFLFSFALWEAFDCVIFNFSNIKLERESITQKLLIDVMFDNNDID